MSLGYGLGMASDPVMLLDSVERPLARLRMVLDQAERELRSLKKAYVDATQHYDELAWAFQAFAGTSSTTTMPLPNRLTSTRSRASRPSPFANSRGPGPSTMG